MKYEEILELVGPFGRYQKRLYLLVFLAGIPNAFVTLHFIFTQYEPDFHCQFPIFMQNYTTQNITDYESLLSFAMPMERDEFGNMKRSQCRKYERDYSSYLGWVKHTDRFKEQSRITDCTNSWQYILEPNQLSAVVEFNMVCQHSWKVPIAVSVYQAGIFLGSLSVLIADRYGRRTVFLWSTLLQIVCTGFGALTWNYSSYLIFNFFTGCFSLVNYVVALVLATEMMKATRRNLVAVGPFYSFALGYMMTAALGYWIQNWRTYLWASSGISLFQIPYYWLLPESARWLIMKGRKEEALDELQKISEMNGRDVDIRKKLNGRAIDCGEGEDEERLYDVIRRPGMRARCIVLYSGWLVACMAYFGISLFSSKFSENRFLNCFFSGLAELPGYIGVYFLIKLIGRPRSILILSLLFGTATAVLPFIPKGFSTGITILAMLGKRSVAAIWYVLYVVTIETSPTLQRSTSMSLGNAFARFGGFVAPYLMFIGNFVTAAPYVVLGILMVGFGLLTILLVPETKGVPLPETHEEAVANTRYYACDVFRGKAGKIRRQRRLQVSEVNRKSEV